MLKFGVYSTEQLKRGRVKTFFGAHKMISVTLLDEVRKDDSLADNFASIMFNLNDDRGSYKRTYASRFDKFDDQCVRFLSDYFPGRELRLHDVAVSSGETAVDFFEKLKYQFQSLSYLATDYDPHLTIIRKGALAVTFTSKDSVVELTFPPFVLTPKRPDRYLYPVNRALMSLLLKTRAKSILDARRTRDRNSIDICEIDLFCPRAKSLANSDNRFNLAQFDILTRSKTSFGCIRAMNVLNEGYFSDDEFQTVLQNFHESIVENGLLIVGTNSDAGSSVSGAIYSKSNLGFEQVWVTLKKPTIDKHIRTYNLR